MKNLKWTPRSCYKIKASNYEELHELYKALKVYCGNPFNKPSNFLIKTYRQIKETLKILNVIND